MDDKTKIGLCQCGCGGETKIATRNDARKGWIKGEPFKIIYRHAPNKGQCGEKAPRWNGGVIKDSQGYFAIRMPDHPRAGNGYVHSHVLIAEKALGKYLPQGAEVHHINGIKGDNRNENLIICPDRAYHALIHQRTRALRDCGHAEWRKCQYCKQYDDPQVMTAMHKPKQKIAYCHRLCSNQARRSYYHSSKQEK